MNFLFCLFLVGGAVFGGVFSLLFFRSKAQRTFNIAWFPYRCICRICLVCRTKKIHRTATTLWKPPVQMLNTKETTDTTCCTR